MAGKDDLYFHSAEVYLKPSKTNPTPRRVAIIQDVSIEIKRDNKELFGENRYAEDVASGNESISGKYKTGALDPAWMAENFLNATKTTGTLELITETVTVASGTATVAGAADFSEDYGVVDTSTTPETVFTRVAATPAAGQYVVNESTGVYTFNVSENGNVLQVKYLKETATGETYTVNNTVAGDSVYCSLFLYKTSRTSKKFGFRLANATFESVSFGFKLNEHTMPEGSFKGFADSSGKVFQLFRGA